MVPCFCQSDLQVSRTTPGHTWERQEPTATDLLPPPAHEKPIGTVAFLTHKKMPAEAILDHEGRWRCPKLPVLDRVLNALHEPRRSTGSGMPFGHAELIRVAAWLKGVVTFPRL